MKNTIINVLNIITFIMILVMLSIGAKNKNKYKEIINKRNQTIDSLKAVNQEYIKYSTMNLEGE